MRAAHLTYEAEYAVGMLRTAYAVTRSNQPGKKKQVKSGRRLYKNADLSDNILGLL
jgi:hypothetical protein